MMPARHLVRALGGAAKLVASVRPQKMTVTVLLRWSSLESQVDLVRWGGYNRLPLKDRHGR